MYCCYLLALLSLKLSGYKNPSLLRVPLVPQVPLKADRHIVVYRAGLYTRCNLLFYIEFFGDFAATRAKTAQKLPMGEFPVQAYSSLIRYKTSGHSDCKAITARLGLYGAWYIGAAGNRS